MPGLDDSRPHPRGGGGGAIHSTWRNTSSALKPFAGPVARSRFRGNARGKGTLRLEGKDYIVQDGDVMHIRHSG